MHAKTGSIQEARMALSLRTRWLAAPVCALALAGCDVTGYEDDIEGRYSYDGSVDGALGTWVEGEVRIHGQRYDEAWADIEWYMVEDDRVVFEVTADDVPVDIDPGGRVSFSTWGDLELSDGRWGEFELYHEGRVTGRNLSGHCELDTDMPSFDEGRFNARR
jgi:hypothetical protein